MTTPLHSGFRVEPADYRTDFADLRAVRETVFVVEQRVPIEEEWDAQDPLCRHVLARDAQDRPIGTGRLTPEHKIGRMAVLPAWRGQGVGEALLTALIAQARALGWAEVALNAQISALGFYRKFGFAAYGDEFTEAGIRHQAMRLALPPLPRIAHTGAAPLPPRQPIQPVDALIDAIAITQTIIDGTQRELCIHSRDLDFGLYAQPQVLDAFKRLATAGRGASVRIMLHDPAAAQASAHPLLALAQRLPSAFALRAIDEPVDAQIAAAFIVNDRGGFYFRAIGSRYEGDASSCHPARARQLLVDFESVWERSRRCTELRALGI